MTDETRRASEIPPEVLDQLLAGYSKPEDLTADDGLFRRLKKALIERALGAELTEHLGYEPVPPVPHRLMAKVNTSLRQQVFDIPQRQREAEVDHHHQADHLRR